MKLYRVEIDDEHRWVGTQTDIVKVKSEWEKLGYRRKGITHEEVEVPTDKKGLIDFLNLYNV